MTCEQALHSKREETLTWNMAKESWKARFPDNINIVIKKKGI